MSEPLLVVDDVVVEFDGFRALNHATVRVERGELRFLIGPNGAGKTSLIDVVTGLTKPTSGSVRFDGRDITRVREHDRVRLGIGRSFQTPTVFQSLTVVENLDLAASFEAILNSSGNSFVHETESQVILNGSYNIGFTMDLALKDLGFATQFGREFGVPLEVAGLVEQTFVRAKAQYGGGAWSSQVVKLLEDAVGVDLRAPGFPAALQ